MIAAVVHAADGVRFAAAGEWANDVMPPLVRYVRQRADHVLWPSAALHVRALIEARQVRNYGDARAMSR
jgi:hypothetical protein